MTKYREHAKTIAINAIIMAIMILCCYSASAQGSPPPQGNGGGGSTSGPIDGGAVGLLIGAAVYGYKQVKSRAAVKATPSPETTTEESV